MEALRFGTPARRLASSYTASQSHGSSSRTSRSGGRLSVRRLIRSRKSGSRRLRSSTSSMFVAVRRREVALTWLVVSEREVSLLLDRSDQQALKVTAYVTDLVKKERVSVRSSKKSLAVRRCTCERAFPVSEQLRPHGLGAVLTTSHTGPVGVLLLAFVGAVRPDPVGHGCLSGAPFTADEDRNVQRRHAPRVGVHPLHGLGPETTRVPDDALFFRAELPRAGCLVCLVEGLDAEFDRDDRRASPAFGAAIGLDHRERRFDKSCFGHQHPDRVHRRSAGTDVQDELPAAKPASDPRELVAKKLEHLAMVGRVVAVPWFEVHAERSLAEHVAKLIDSSPFSDGATLARHSVQEDYIPPGSAGRVSRIWRRNDGIGQWHIRAPSSWRTPAWSSAL